jgi:hypothetical protein
MLNQQTKFYRRRGLAESTPEQIQEFKQSWKRVQQLFAELEQLRLFGELERFMHFAPSTHS